MLEDQFEPDVEEVCEEPEEEPEDELLEDGEEELQQFADELEEVPGALFT